MGPHIDHKLPFHEKNFEVKWAKLKPGERREKTAASKSNTLSILIYGKHKVIFPDKNESLILQKEGDYVFFGPGVNHTWENLEESLVLAIRWPQKIE